MKIKTAKQNFRKVMAAASFVAHHSLSHAAVYAMSQFFLGLCLESALKATYKPPDLV